MVHRVVRLEASNYLRMLSAGLLIVSLALSALGKPVATSNLEVHEAIAAPPSGFVQNGPASPDTVLSLRLALVNSDMSGLIKSLYDVSTPSSSSYGQHLSKAEVRSPSNM